MKISHWLIVGILSATPAFAQWENVKHANVPRTADGKPNLSRRRRDLRTASRTYRGCGGCRIAALRIPVSRQSI